MLLNNVFFFHLYSDIFDAMFLVKHNVGEIVIQQGKIMVVDYLFHTVTVFH